jgi:hypothetical protein
VNATVVAVTDVDHAEAECNRLRADPDVKQGDERGEGVRLRTRREIHSRDAD